MTLDLGVMTSSPMLGIEITFKGKKKQQNTVFSSAQRTFSRIDRILGHKTSYNKFKRIEILSSIFSDYIDMKLDINYKKKTGKATNTLRLNNVLLNNYWIKEEI